MGLIANDDTLYACFVRKWHFLILDHRSLNLSLYFEMLVCVRRVLLQCSSSQWATF